MNTKNKRNYINKKIFGLPTPKTEGRCTSPTKAKGTELIYEKTINGKTYHVVALHRGGVYKSKYFKDFTTAKTYVEMLRINRFF